MSIHVRSSIDGAHLKGKYLGIMFLAIGMNGNNQILPFALGVGKTEKCIEDMPSLAIISDRSSSIEMDIQVVFLNAYHGLFCRHLLINMRAKIGKQ
uniref:MULE transposase domain-containing protein n=1 Tax=Lactuca sativa TaxID=4236 RepID=A0A9R1V460_LACSA|nr:hypothetical protein LSAT_V11C700352950 [Lactuca sativa]